MWKTTPPEKKNTFPGKKRCGHTRKKEIEEIKVGVEEKKKTQGMRRD